MMDSIKITLSVSNVSLSVKSAPIQLLAQPVSTIDNILIQPIHCARRALEIVCNVQTDFSVIFVIQIFI